MPTLTLIITVPLTIFCVLFAVSNTGAVEVGLWPFEGTQKLPVWLLGLGLLGAGFVLGALFIWILAQRTQFLYWRESRKSARLEKELEDIHARAQKETTPALPVK